MSVDACDMLAFVARTVVTREDRVPTLPLRLTVGLSIPSGAAMMRAVIQDVSRSECSGGTNMTDRHAGGCIYCGSPGPFSDEHVVSAGLGGDNSGWLLANCVCRVCNPPIFLKLDLKF